MASAGQAQLTADGPVVKRRAACDECRLKKLKCGGEQPACLRCTREQIPCVYSPQKQMGRPKKRCRNDEEAQAVESNNTTSLQISHAMPHISWNQDSAIDQGSEKFADADLFNLSHPDIAICRQPWKVPEVPTFSASSSLRVPDLTPDGSDDSPLSLAGAEPGSSEMTAAPMNRSALEMGLRKDVDHAPSIVSAPPLPSLTTCACLSAMYLTQDKLSSMAEPFTFPYSLQPLREAMAATLGILDCQVCPRRFITGLQNTQSIGALSLSIAERFAKVLDSIAEEATRAAAAGVTKKFLLADLTPNNLHLHTGGLSCAAQFSVDLSPAEWRKLCKKVVRAEVYGPADGQDCCPYLQGLFDQMRARQQRWHAVPLPQDTPLQPTLLSARGCGRGNPGDDDHLCLKWVDFAQKMVESFDWT